MPSEREVDALTSGADRLAPGLPMAVAALRADPDPVALLRRGDGGPKVTYANPALVARTGLAIDRLVGRVPSVFLSEAGDLDNDPAAVHGTVVDLRDADGRRHRCRISAWALDDGLVAWRLVPSELDLTDSHLGPVVGALVSHAVAVARHGAVLTGTPDWSSAFSERAEPIGDLLLWLEERGAHDPRYIDAHHALRDVLHRHSPARSVDLPTTDDRWLSFTITGLDGEDSVAAMVSIIDVTDRKRRESDLAERMLTDSLTSLPNRSLTLDRLHHALTHNPRAHEGVAVLFVDLDTIITGDMSAMFETGPQVTMVQEWKRLVDYLNPFRAQKQLSSVFAFDAGREGASYDAFVADPVAAQQTFRIEQYFLAHHATALNTWPAGWIESFKRHLLPPRLGVRDAETVAQPDAQCKMLIFHGEPRPIDVVQDQVWGKRFRYGHGPIPYMLDYWRQFGVEPPTSQEKVS